MTSLRPMFAGMTLAVVAVLAFASGAAEASIAQPSVVSDYAASYTPNLVATSTVKHPHADAVSQSGNTMYVGGLFDSITDSTGLPFTVENMVSFDASTGAIATGFTPAFNGNVWAVEATSTAVYVGGAFTTVDGVTHPALVKLDPTTGAIDPAFDAHFQGGQVNQIQLLNGVLYVAGSSGKKLMALDPLTGANVGIFNNLAITTPIPNAWGTVSVYHFAINPAGTQLVATGNFETVGGQSRTRFFIANLGGGTATLDPWYYAGFAKPCSSTAPRRIAYLQDVDFSPDGSYFIVTATGQVPLYHSDIWHNGVTNPTGTTVCDAAGRFDISNGDSTHQPVWINYTGGDSIWAAAATGVAVYVQGHFQWLDNPDGIGSRPAGNAVNRRGLGAIDPTTGLALSWTPDKPAQSGGKALLATTTGLWVMSDSKLFHGQPHYGIAFAPL